MIQNNPLQQYFRQPAIHIKLPSNGEFYPNGSLDMPPTGEIPVYPMTAIDEITYRTPDALFNGQAVVSVIQSCIPNIKDAWASPATDVNAILTQLANGGVRFDNFHMTDAFVRGGTFSLDGIHLTARANAYIANQFAAAINAKYGSTLRMYKPQQFPLSYPASLN
jgi:hypothetical protein